MEKLKALSKSRVFWATISGVLVATVGPAAGVITGALQTISCTLQTCV